MSDSYKKVIQVPITTGLTGIFIGFQNTGATAQNVTVAGVSLYNSTKVPNVDVTINVAAGQTVRINCNKIVPATFPVLGFLY